MPRKKKTDQPEVAKVEDYPDLVRDLSNNAIINTNETAFEQRLNKIKKAELDKKQSDDIVKLKEDVKEIKELLKKLASK